jgi:hypothetical protein
LFVFISVLFNKHFVTYLSILFTSGVTAPVVRRRRRRSDDIDSCTPQKYAGTNRFLKGEGT